jgi:enoyl-CoA hydratase/carnithine racemase
MALTNFTPTFKFEDYKEKFKEHLIMERKNGIILVRIHTQGKGAQWSFELHRALGQAWQEIGGDPENEVMIFTGTGDYWLRQFDKESFDAIEGDWEKFTNEYSYEYNYHDATKLIENFIWDIDIPSIGVINGPGWHFECALLCDITLCAEHALLVEPHLLAGLVPGDGLYLVLQKLLGLKRAAYYMYTGKTIDAKTAYEWGMVNEVLPKDKLMNRAWELAEMIIQQNPRVTRRMTSQLVRRPWKRLLVDDFQVHFGHEMYAWHVDHKKMKKHSEIPIEKKWEKKKKDKKK